MADRKHYEALYQSIARDLQKMKSELIREIGYSATQVSAMYDSMQKEGTLTVAKEIRYGYKQTQNIYEGIENMLKGNVTESIQSLDDKISTLEELQGMLNDLNELKYSYQQLQAAYEALNVHSDKVLEAVEAIPEEIDYARITDEVGDKLLEIINQLKADTKPFEVDYDRIVDSTVEKVVEAMPYPEKVDYNRITEAMPKAEAVDYDKIVNETAEKVLSKLPQPEALDMDALANAVAAKIVIPAPVVPAAPEVDYERLAELVAEKLAAKEQTYDVVLDEEGIDSIAAKVSEKLNVTVAVDYDKVCQAAMAAQILPDPVDYDRIGEIVEDKLGVENEEETSYDLVLDEEGINAIAKGVAEELRCMCAVCECAPESEEPAPAEEVVEEVLETVEEPAPVEEAPAPQEPEVKEELAATAAPLFDDMEGDQLVDAETGLVIRLKKSFTAKLKQSEEKVKVYYSDIKNELTSYKRINSNVSWHGDRFNLGRETIAKLNICGKTLCFYLALDPNDPEYKTTVYHQKDVGGQKAYENTPFMVKVKSDAAAKKALRLVGYLAEKLGAEKEENFEAVDYVSEYGYETTKKLFEDGFIKATKEKKVDLDF